GRPQRDRDRAQPRRPPAGPARLPRGLRTGPGEVRGGPGIGADPPGEPPDDPPLFRADPAPERDGDRGPVMKWLRSVVAVGLGVLLCISIVSLIEGIGHRVFPPTPEVQAIIEPISKMPGSEGMAALNEELAKPDVRAAFLAQPFTVYLPPLFAWVVAAMMGSWAAGLIARRSP